MLKPLGVRRDQFDVANVFIGWLAYHKGFERAQDGNFIPLQTSLAIKTDSGGTFLLQPFYAILLGFRLRVCFCFSLPE